MIRTGTAGTGRAAVATLLLLGLALEGDWKREWRALTIFAHRAHAWPGAFMAMVSVSKLEMRSGRVYLIRANADPTGIRRLSEAPS